jgi:hypothetical protein
MIRRVPNYKLEAVLFVRGQPGGEAQRWQIAKHLSLNQRQAANLVNGLVAEGQLQITGAYSARVHPDSPAFVDTGAAARTINALQCELYRRLSEELVDAKPDDPVIDELLVGAAFLLERAAMHLETSRGE